MYSILHDLLADKKGGEIFVLFGGWHFFYMGVVAALIAFALLRNRNREGLRMTGSGIRNAGAFLCDLGFYMYIADFFLMPFAYEEIDIEKLPFHVCTAMCVMCYISRRSKRLKTFYPNIALLGFVSNLVYLIYPAGVMWHAVHPSSYRVIQTLLFHAIMTAGCTLTILDREYRPGFKAFWKNAVTVGAMTVWAVLGNLFYYGSAGKYDNDFNWFFVTADPFEMIRRPEGAYIMPFVTTAAFLLVEAMVCLIFKLTSRRERSAEK